MTRVRTHPASGREALAPDVAALDERSSRAWTERMAVRRLPDDRYVVDGESTASYVVDLKSGSCTCPDHQIRGERCKHLRRVAIEVTLDRVPPPGKVLVQCEDCGRNVAIDGGDPPPHLCRDCHLEPGSLVTDRETGDTVRVVRITDREARDVEIPKLETTVAEHPTNDGYPPDDLVVEVTYPQPARTGNRRVYSFPISRLRGEDEPDERQLPLTGRGERTRRGD